MEHCVLSSSYFPPIPWFTVAARAGHITIDLHEHYIKQSWRNRCTIATANGPMNLVVPVVKYRNHTPVHEILVDYSTNWQRVHEHAIRSAYGKSPYFEFYAHRIMSLYEWQPQYLHELNSATFRVICELLKLNITWAASKEYPELANNALDWRNELVPGTPSAKIPQTKTYIQVFADRYGFQPGLSILDLLFCAGPESKDILMAQ